MVKLEILHLNAKGDKNIHQGYINFRRITVVLPIACNKVAEKDTDASPKLI